MTLSPADRAKLIATLKKKQVALKGTPSENDNIVTLVGALPSMRLVLAWPKLNLSVPAEPVDIDKGMSDVQKLWASVALDFEEAAVAARIPFTMIETHVREAQLNGWVWPDGSISENALRLAKSTISRLAKGKEKGTQ